MRAFELSAAHVGRIITIAGETGVMVSVNPAAVPPAGRSEIRLRTATGRVRSFFAGKGTQVVLHPDAVAEGYELDVIADVVHHPSHYGKGRFGIECIAITRYMSFEAGNAFKYVWRWQEKNGLQDLEKALVYLRWVREHDTPIWVSGHARKDGLALIDEHVLPALPENLDVYRVLVQIGDDSLSPAEMTLTRTIDDLKAGRPALTWKDLHS